MDNVSLFSAEIDGGTVPEWVHLVPAGTFQGRDGRGPYVADLKAVVQRTWKHHKGTDIVVDYEHQTHHAAKNGAPALAAGWVKDLEVRSDGVWGRVEWTAAARSRIAGREYRYTSPALTHSQSKPHQVGIILNVGLVNQPNLELVALNSATLPGAPAMSLKDKIAAALDLDMDAADDEVVSTLHARLDGAGQPDPRFWVPRDQVERMIRDSQAHQVTAHAAGTDRLVSDAIKDGKLPPALKDWAMALCSADPASFTNFVSNAPQIITPGADPRFARAVPDADAVSTHAASPEESTVTGQLGISVTELRKAQR